MANIVYFVTTNARKYEEYKELIEEQGITLKQYDAELIEPQTTDEMAIIKHKLAQAKELLPGKQILVDDRGFTIPALNGFPGPMLKLVLASVGIDGFLSLMRGKQDRQAIFVTSLGYYDGHHDSFFQAREEGFLLEAPKGDNLRGWNELLYIYGCKNSPGKSLAEYTDAEWYAYLDELNDGDVIKQFLRHV